VIAALNRVLKQVGKFGIIVGIVVAVIGLYLYGSGGGFQATQQTMGGAIPPSQWGLPIAFIGLLILIIGAFVAYFGSRDLDITLPDDQGGVKEGDKEPKLEIYTSYFGLWTKTRDERTEYNKYFLSLLFVDTLVGIFTALLGATVATAYTALTRTLLLVILAAAVIISAVWGCKLFTLNIVEGSLQSVLRAMEQKYELPVWEMRFKMQLVPFWESTEKTARGRLGMGLFQDRQHKEAHSHWWHHLMWWASYWALPLLFVIIFAILLYLFSVNPSLIPLPSSALQNVSTNATHNASNVSIALSNLVQYG
jgi:ABC-type antimicrobial peptide transport system permease subunit